MSKAKLVWRLVLVAALAVVLLAAGAGWLRPRQGRPRINEKATLSILRSESLAFLVTRRTVTQVVVEHEQADLLGDWHGVLWATVSWRWGVDLTKIQERDIRRLRRPDGSEAVIVRLPEPELLDFGVEPGSTGFMSKSTFVPKMREFFFTGSQRAHLEARLKEHALEFAGEEGLLPTRKDMVRQLNDATGAVKAATGFELVFE